MGNAKLDQNSRATLTALSSTDGVTIVPLYADPTTHRLLTDSAAGSGTVTSVSVVTANGISGSVATATTTPAITLTLGAITPSSVTVSGLTASQLVATDASKVLQSLAVATYPSLVEIAYVKGVTSAIQTQIDAKGSGTVTAVSVASANGFAGTSSGGATPALTLSTSITGVLKGNGTAISAATAGTDYAVGSTGLAGGQTIAGSTLTLENLTLRANAADLTTGQINVTSSKEATNTTTASVALAGGLAVAKRIYALDMTVTNTITGTTSGNLVSGGALGTPSSGTGTNITGIPAANILAGSFGAGAYVISTSLQAATIELGHASDTTLARVSAGVVSIEGTAVLTVAGGTLTGSITLGENTGIALDPAGSADGKWSGVTIVGTGGATIAFGRLVYLKAADSRWWETDANASATAGPVMIGMTVTSTTAGAAVTILLVGQIRADASFPTLTIGAPVYVGETAGNIQVAIPTGADNVIRVVGFALTADEIYFNPSQDHQVTVA